MRRPMRRGCATHLFKWACICRSLAVLHWIDCTDRTVDLSCALDSAWICLLFPYFGRTSWLTRWLGTRPCPPATAAAAGIMTVATFTTASHCCNDVYSNAAQGSQHWNPRRSRLSPRYASTRYPSNPPWLYPFQAPR